MAVEESAQPTPETPEEDYSQPILPGNLCRQNRRVTTSWTECSRGRPGSIGQIRLKAMVICVNALSLLRRCWALTTKPRRSII